VRYDDFWKGRGPIEGGFQIISSANLRGGWGVNAQVQNVMQAFDSASYASYRVTARGTIRTRRRTLCTTSGA